MDQLEIIMTDEQDKVNLPKDLIEKMRQVIEESLKYEGLSLNCEISLLFVDNARIKELNSAYRGKDQATDVLSFPQYEDMASISDYEEKPALGDIVISLERAEEQAQEFGHSLQREVCFLTAHSMFHLFGYDHETEEEAKHMRPREEAVLEKLGISRDK